MKSRGRRVEQRKVERAASKILPEDQKKQRDLARSIAGLDKKSSKKKD